jgi:uncharacterized protein YhaN
MRFLKIAYRRFGPFDHKVFDLSQGNYGLHLFYGPNEAGKSVALRGLRYLLFGMPHNRCEDFRYQAQEQQLEAHLCDRQGNVLRFVRVRGRNQLRAPGGGAAVSQEQLNAFLCGLTKDQFDMLFGLDHSCLLAGGQEILKGKGSVGEALFAAGAGLAGLRRLQEVLEKRCDSLYLQSGKRPLINQTLTSIEQAKKNLQQAMLKVETWQEQVTAHRQATERKTDLEQRRRDVRAEISRLRTCLLAVPRIRRWNELREELQRLPPRDPILDEEHLLNELREKLGACLKAHQDQAGLIQHSRAKKDRATILLRTHFQRDDLEQVAELCPSTATRQRIRELSQERKASLEAHERAQTDLASRTRQIEDLQRRLAEFPDLPDVSQLEALRASISGQGPLEQQARRAQVALAERQQKAQLLLGRLQACWSGSLEEALALRVPAKERVTEFNRKFQELEQSRRELERSIQDLDKTIRDAERTLKRLEQSGPIPSEEALTEARAERDRGLQLVRTAWLELERLDSDLAQAFVGRHAPGGHLLDALKNSIARCDDLADRLRREAQRVADRNAQEQRRADAAAERERSQQSLALLQQKITALQEAWQAEWPSSVAPRDPAEMLDWLHTHAQLLELVPQMRSLEVELVQCQDQIDSARTRLQTALALEPDPEQSLQELLELARQRIAEVHRQAQERRDLETQLGEARRGFQEAQDTAARAEHRLAQWAANWREAIQGLGLEHDALPEAVQVRLDCLDEITSELRDAAELDKRISDIDRDRKAFLERLTSLRARLTPSCPPSTLESMQTDIDALAARLRQARERETLRTTWQREELHLRQELLEQAGSKPLEEFCNEILSEADTFKPRLEALQEEERNLDAEIDDLSEKAGRAKSQLEAWEQASSQAAEHRQEGAFLLARLREQVVEYAACCLARGILSRAVENFRQRHQGTMLGRAGKYFQELTCGAFKKLEVVEDNGGNLVLQAVRPHPADPAREEWVEIDGLSDGTRDQLFLALRLAGIEEHLDRVGPMPVIADDLLVNFDNPRTEATLRCLAELSNRTQVLLLTHHEHVRELARRTLREGENLFCYEL